VTILDPSKAFSGMWVGDTPVTRVRPDPCGILPMGDGSFDLITCFGVLHHIPNVSFVLRELWRVLDRDGIMLLREPTVSMGDWRKTRGNLTKHERGLHLPLLREAIGRAGFGVAREAPVMFPAWRRACQRVGVEPFSVAWATRVDQALCRLFAWQRSYHPTSVAQKLRPSSAYFVLRRTP
jgi:SAM-dependent methyltransferase